MAQLRIIEYQGLKFRASKTNPKYYYADIYKDGGRKKIALHRYKFIEKYGSIPKGYDIHHIDGDAFNNDIDNLEAIERGLHRSSHQKSRMANKEYRENAIQTLRDSDLKAREWHKSEDGLKWHSENAKKMWENKKLYSLTCDFCQKPFETAFPTRTIYCSHLCNQRNRSSTKKDFVTRNCVKCNKEFEINKRYERSVCKPKCE
jgi:hypothetical protein